MLSASTLENLTSFLVALDQLLTGHTEKEARAMVNQLDEPEKYLSGAEYYLSDGGYSRLYISVASDEINLGTLNRLDKVKKNWQTLPVRTLVIGLKQYFMEIREELI